ncbi:MAG: hypothetical protein ACT4QF_23780 [Sporichthyaceae bacterium]|jgi:hypothetical protein
MNLAKRMGLTALAVASLSVFAAPVAGAATTDATARDNGKIRVCIEDVRDDARVRVDRKTKTIDDGECYTFKNLDRGRVYRVSVDLRDSRRDQEIWIRAEREARRVTYYGNDRRGGDRFDDRFDRRNDDRFDRFDDGRGFNDRFDGRYDRYNDRYDRGYWDPRP